MIHILLRNKQLTDITGRAIADNVVLLNELEEFDLYMYFTFLDPLNI